MTIHVPLSEFAARIDELVAAARRGEEVVIGEAGVPALRLVQVGGSADADPVAGAARRASALGMWSHVVDGRDIVVRDLKPSDAEQEADYRRKFGPAA